MNRHPTLFYSKLKWQIQIHVHTHSKVEKDSPSMLNFHTSASKAIFDMDECYK